MSRSVGCVAPRTIVAVGDQGVCWLSGRGVEYYAPGVGIRHLTPHLRDFLKAVSWADIETTPGIPWAEWLETEQEYVCFVPVANGQNNFAIVVNLSRLGAGEVAVTLWRSGTPSGLTAYVDEDGYMQVQEDSTREQFRTEHGYTFLDVYGVYGKKDADGYLELDTVGYDPASGIVADRAGERSRLVVGGYDGFARYFDYGEKDDVLSDGTGGVDIAVLVFTRDFFAEAAAAHHMKRLSECEVAVSTPAAATVTVTPYVDGRAGKDVTLSYPATNSDKPVTRRARLLPRQGLRPQLALRTVKAKLRFSKLRLWADIERKAR